MPNRARRVTLDELAADLPGIFDRVVTDGESVVVEKPGGAKAVLGPLSRRRQARGRTVTQEDYQAFLSSAGGWADVDTEGLKKVWRKSRDMPTRSPVGL